MTIFNFIKDCDYINDRTIINVICNKLQVARGNWYSDYVLMFSDEIIEKFEFAFSENEITIYMK